MTRQEVIELMRQMATVFGTVRLTDASHTTCLYEKNGALEPSEHHCFETWHKESRCENCISAKAMACKGTQSKFEFADDSVCYAVARYIEMDGKPYALEMVSGVDDGVMVGIGKERFIHSVTDYNRKLYIDSLTGAYNRRYFDEQLQTLPGEVGLAIIDVDNFKQVNDTFGHQAGDMALQAVAEVMRQSVRGSDAVVRYGGDEFLLVMHGIPDGAFPDRLEVIRRGVADVRMEEWPDMRLSVSIGAACCAGETAAAMRRVDEQLYEAKETKNAVKFR